MSQAHLIQTDEKNYFDNFHKQKQLDNLFHY